MQKFPRTGRIAPISDQHAPRGRNPPMQMTTALLIVNPCDDEEDNMAMLCCHSDQGLSLIHI